MGVSLTKQTDIDKAEQIKIQLQDWLTMRDNTIKEINSVADELDTLHRRAMYSKMFGSLAGVVGGGMALTGLGMSFFTAGSSLALTGPGLALATTGGVTVTAAGFTEWFRQKTRVRNAQQALEEDRKMLKVIFEQIEESVEAADIDNEQRNQFLTTLRSFLNNLGKVWVTGIAIYDRTRHAVPKVIDTAKRTSTSLVKFGDTMSRTANAVANGMAGAAFVAFDLTQLVRHSVEVLKGSPSDAAVTLRDLSRKLINEKVSVMNDYINHMNKLYLRSSTL